VPAVISHQSVVLSFRCRCSFLFSHCSASNGSPNAWIEPGEASFHWPRGRRGFPPAGSAKEMTLPSLPQGAKGGLHDVKMCPDGRRRASAIPWLVNAAARRSSVGYDQHCNSAPVIRDRPPKLGETGVWRQRRRIRRGGISPRRWPVAD